MPRTKGRNGLVHRGVRVPGVYEDLLLRERERQARRPHTMRADPTEPGVGCFRRSTHLLRALEAGEPVTVSAWQLSSRRVQVPASLRPVNCFRVWLRVSADDVVEKTDSPVVDRVSAPVHLEEDD